MSSKPLYPNITVSLPEGLSFHRSIRRTMKIMRANFVPENVMDQWFTEVMAYGPGVFDTITSEYVTLQK